METEMKSKQIAMITLALSLAGAANAGAVEAVIVTPKMLQVVRMQQTALDAEPEMTQAFNACSDAIRESSGEAARNVCVSALRTTRSYLQDLAASPILHGTIDAASMSENMAAAYSNAALAYWRAGDLGASRSHIERARALAPKASFVIANASYLTSEAAAAGIAKATLASN
jgi:hypothetical protein